MIFKELPLSLLKALLGRCHELLSAPDEAPVYERRGVSFPRSALAKQALASLVGYLFLSHPTCSLNAFYSFTHYRGRRLAGDEQ